MSTPKELYDVVCKYSLIGPALFFPPYFFVNAPFGRFSPSDSWLLIDGIKAWLIMEIVSPIVFLTVFLSSPLTRPASSLKQSPLSPPPIFTNTSFTTFNTPNAPALLAFMFLGHYLNRALVSPLRTPSRSKSHISVPLSGMFFNVVNGSLMGAFVAALACSKSRSGLELKTNWTFWTGVGMWALGFASNIWHDEILLNLRRTQRTAAPPAKGVQHSDTKPHYAIPHGGLYSLISYPNYFSEWFEWLGYAIAATALTTQLPSTHVLFPFSGGRLGLGSLSTLPYIQHLTPPWLFFLSEIFLMFPRAWNGHRWYLKTFPDYPRERNAVVPFLI